MSESAPPPPAALDPTGSGSRQSLLGLAGTGVVILLLIIGGVMTGANLWPRVVKVERRVVTPVRDRTRQARIEEQLPDLVDAACPAIVRVLLPAPAPIPTPTPVRRTRRGAAHKPPAAPLPLEGFVVSDDGYIVTSAARLAGQGDNVPVLLGDGRRLDAAVLGSDPVAGIAVLKVDADDLTPLAFADGGWPRIGGWGFTLASPNGTGCAVATGLIAADSPGEQATLRSYVRVVTDGDLVEGAPFLDSAGEVIGIAAYRTADELGATGAVDQLLPGSVAGRAVAEFIRAGKAPVRPFGILAGDLDTVLARRLGANRQRGAVVLLIAPGSPADKAGLRVGDVVVSAGGAPVAGATELARALDPDATSLPLAVARRAEDLTITLRQ